MCGCRGRVQAEPTLAARSAGLRQSTDGWPSAAPAGGTGLQPAGIRAVRAAAAARPRRRADRGGIGPRRHRARPVRPRRLGRPRRHRPPAQGRQPRGHAARPPAGRDRPPAARPPPPRRRGPGAGGLRPPRIQPQGVDHRPLREPLRHLRAPRHPRRDHLVHRGRGRRTASRSVRSPIRKHYRCPVCRDQLGGGEQRQAPLDANDLKLALDRDSGDARDVLRDRFPVLEGGESLADELLDLHTPRQLAALAAILERVEGDLRAAPIASALRLAILHALGPASRLATSPGRVAPLKIAGGHVRLPGGAHWRERNPWLAFEDGVRLVRGFVQRLESGAWGPVPARLGDDLRSLVEGSATAMLKQGTSAALGALQLETAHLADAGERPRVRLVVGTPPLRPVDRAPRLGLPRDGVGPRARGRGDAAPRAAVRARGAPVVGLAGGGRHPGPARRRAGPQPRTRGSCSCSRATGRSRWSRASWAA